MSEARETFDCFGSTCSVFVLGDGFRHNAAEAAAQARRTLLGWHDRFTRFTPDSELSRLNADPRAEVPVSPAMARLVQAVKVAYERTGGLVDASLLEPLEQSGYRSDLRTSHPLDQALEHGPARAPARPAPSSRIPDIVVDRASLTVRRPPGLRLDSGGIGKGLFADLVAERLEYHDGYAVECAGDVRIGGSGNVMRKVRVTSPFDGEVLHTLEVVTAGIATSGIGRRSWLDGEGRPAHHLLDPATGRPAFTGIVQVTAIAPTAFEAELRAKAALLVGPEAARDWLPDGGVVVLDDGACVVHDPSTLDTTPRG